MISEYRKVNGNKDATPNTITYNSVLDAHARRGDIEGAKFVWEMMKEDFNAGNTNGAVPNIRTYNILIGAYAKSSAKSSNNNNNDHRSNNSPNEAELLLTEMLHLYSKNELSEGPDTITYSGVINCWAKSDRPEGPQRALEILKAMAAGAADTNGNENENNNIRPNTITYAAVMDAHARQGDVDGANEVWEMMKEDFNNGNTSAKPNLTTYNILIDAHAKSGHENAPAEVEKILSEIHHRKDNGQLPEGPDKITYKSLIMCLEKYKGTEDRVRAFKMEASKKK